jgi:hypothetical protein
MQVKVNNNNKETKNAIIDSKTRKSLTFNSGKLNQLSAISVDKNVARLLTNLGGKIELEIQGQTSNVKVTFKEKGRDVSITIDEFNRIFSAPALIARALKNKRTQEEFSDVSSHVATIMVTYGLDSDQIQPLSSETFGLIKQSLAGLKNLQKNLEIAELFMEKFPEDPFGEALHRYVTVSIAIVAKGITRIATGEMKISESNSEQLAKRCMPNWIFQKLLKGTIDRNATPSLFLFPRKREKGLTMSTKELRTDDLVAINSTILARSELLIKLVRNDDFLAAVIPHFNDMISDEANAEILNNFQWHIFPTLGNETVKDFLLSKNKSVTLMVTDSGGANLKKRLLKLGNALLRTSLLENSGGRPDLTICKHLYPSDTVTNFFPETESFYDVLAKQPNIDKTVRAYLNLSDASMTALFYQLLTLELGHSFSKDMEKLIHEEQFGFTPAAVPKSWEKFIPGMTGKTTFNQESIPEEPMYPTTGIDVDLLIGTKIIEKGDAKRAKKENIEVILFKVYKQDKQASKKGKNSSGPPPNIVLGKNGRKLTTVIRNKIGPETAVDVGNFLCGFSYMRMQEEALKRISAAMDKGFNAFVDSIDDENDGENTEEYENLFDDIA